MFLHRDSQFLWYPIPIWGVVGPVLESFRLQDAHCFMVPSRLHHFSGRLALPMILSWDKHLQPLGGPPILRKSCAQKAHEVSDVSLSRGVPFNPCGIGSRATSVKNSTIKMCEFKPCMDRICLDLFEESMFFMLILSFFSCCPHLEMQAGWKACRQGSWASITSIQSL